MRTCRNYQRFSTIRLSIVLFVVMLLLSMMSASLHGSTPVLQSNVGVALLRSQHETTTEPNAKLTGLTSKPQGATQTRFGSIKVIVTIGDLYISGSSIGDKAYIELTIGKVLNRYVARYVLPQLRKQRFKVTYGGVRQTLPKLFKEPTLLIDYEESEGARYFGNNGVNIECSLYLFGVQSHEDDVALSSILLTASNNLQVEVNFLDSNGSFRQDSLNELKEEFESLELDYSEFKN